MRKLLLMCAAVMLFIAAGCKDDVTEPSRIIFPSSGVSFAAHVHPLFQETCAFVGCHDDATKPHGLSLTTYDNLMYGQTFVVVRGDPENSRLVWSIEGRNGYTRMPMYGPLLTDNQIRGIRIWITEGAQNN